MPPEWLTTALSLALLARILLELAAAATLAVAALWLLRRM